MTLLVQISLLLWLALLLVPWRPWSTRERLDAEVQPVGFSDLTVLIPARNEAAQIGRTLQALAQQGEGLRVVLVDDQSTDETAQIAAAAFPDHLTIVPGTPLPNGWTGKLWALEQGRGSVFAENILLLDADIELAPGIAVTLLRKLRAEKLDLVSIMAELRMHSLAEKMLVPAFVYFFKLIYPFQLGNNPRSRVGVAAGGCILIRSEMLRKIGGFAALRGALIDDCTLARKVKEAGGRTWIGLSHSVLSHRPYCYLADFWEMVARTAYTQLGYSTPMLGLTTVLILLVFWVPVAGLFFASSRIPALLALATMGVCYFPTLHYYGRSVLWILTLPMTGFLFLLMTWSSAIRYWQGKRSSWKGRVYGKQ